MSNRRHAGVMGENLEDFQGLAGMHPGVNEMRNGARPFPTERR